MTDWTPGRTFNSCRRPSRRVRRFLSWFNCAHCRVAMLLTDELLLFRARVSRETTLDEKGPSAKGKRKTEKRGESFLLTLRRRQEKTAAGRQF